MIVFLLFLDNGSEFLRVKYMLYRDGTDMFIPALRIETFLRFCKHILKCLRARQRREKILLQPEKPIKSLNLDKYLNT